MHLSTRARGFLVILAATAALLTAYGLGRSAERSGRGLALASSVFAQGSNNGSQRKTYYPNTEELGSDEMRVISLVQHSNDHCDSLSGRAGAGSHVPSGHGKRGLPE